MSRHRNPAVSLLRWSSTLRGMRVRIYIGAIAVLGALAGCTSGSTPSPAAAPQPVASGTAAKPCAEEQTEPAGLLTPQQVWPAVDSSEGGQRVVSLNAARCRAGSTTLACELGFPWVMTRPDDFLGSNGVKLWGQAELTASLGTRTQSIRQSVVVFPTAQNDGINTITRRAADCGAKAESHTLGRVQLVLEFGGNWKPSDTERVRAAAIAVASHL